MREVLSRVANRVRVEIAGNTTLAVLWAVMATLFSGHLPGGQTVFQYALAAAYLAAAALAFRKGQRRRPVMPSSPEPRSVFAHMANLDPLADLPRRGLVLSVAGTATFALALLLAATTPKAHGANIGAGFLLAAGYGLAAVGPILTLQFLAAVRKPESSLP